MESWKGAGLQQTVESVQQERYGTATHCGPSALDHEPGLRVQAPGLQVRDDRLLVKPRHGALQREEAALWRPLIHDIKRLETALTLPQMSGRTTHTAIARKHLSFNLGGR